MTRESTPARRANKVGSVSISLYSVADEFLTVMEVAELLKINQQTVRNWADRGEIPVVRVGSRRVRIRKSDLDAFLSADSHSLPEPARVDADETTARAWVSFRTAMSAANDESEVDDTARLADALESLAQASSELARALRERSRN